MRNLVAQSQAYNWTWVQKNWVYVVSSVGLVGRDGPLQTFHVLILVIMSSLVALRRAMSIHLREKIFLALHFPRLRPLH